MNAYGARAPRRAALLPYLLDWLVVLAIIAFAGSTSLWITPAVRPFNPADPTISFPYQTKSKIPNWLLIVLMALFPVIVIVVSTLLASPPARLVGRKLKRSTLNPAILGLALSIATSMLLTDTMKNLIGKPRPDMLSRCDMDETLIERYRYGRGPLVGWEVCRTLHGTAKQLDELKDGFRSFPSGHASMSFSGLTYLSLFLFFYVFPTPSLSSSSPKFTAASSFRLPRIAGLFLCSIPVLIAIFVATTRVSDFRHHPFDVLFGSVEGFLCALLGWGWYGRSCLSGQEMYALELPMTTGDVEETPIVEDGIVEVVVEVPNK